MTIFATAIPISSTMAPQGLEQRIEIRHCAGPPGSGSYFLHVEQQVHRISDGLPLGERVTTTHTLALPTTQPPQKEMMP